LIIRDFSFYRWKFRWKKF